MQKFFKTATLILLACLLASCPDKALIRYSAEFDAAPRMLPDAEEMPSPEFTPTAYDPAFTVSTQSGPNSLHFDFSTLDSDFWYAREQDTGANVSSQLYLDDGSLIISAQETDRNPFVYSKPLPLPEGAVFRVKRRARVSFTNNYFAGAFALMACDSPSLQPQDDETYLGGVMHINFVYDPGRYPTIKGFVARGDDVNKPNGNIVIEHPPFGEWMEEEIVYDSSSGNLVYRLNGKDYSVSSIPMTQPYIRIYMHAYGWFTGHKAEVDWLNLSIEMPPGTFSGFGPGRVLGQKQVAPSDRAQTYQFASIQITLPPDAVDTDQELSVIELDSAGDALEAWEISLGQITSFDRFLEIQLPYPDTSAIPGNRQSDKIIAATWDPQAGAWRQEIAEFGKDSMTVRLNHLTTVAILERGSAPTSEYFPSAGAGSQSPADYLSAAWSSFCDGQDLASQAGSLAGLLADFPLLESINSTLDNLGNAAMLIDISSKLIQGETREASLAAFKAATSWAAGKLASSTIQIASLGTFMIDYSLNRFATEILGSQFLQYEAAYHEYELKRGRKIMEWYTIIEGILANARSAEEAGRMMEAEFNSYVNRLWAGGELSDEYAEYEILVWEQKGSGLFGITASLTPEVKKTISENYKEILAQRLAPVFTRLAYKARTNLETHYFNVQRDLDKALSRYITVTANVDGLPKGATAQSALYEGDTVLCSGQRINADGDSGIKAPVKEILKKGIPDTIVLRVVNGKDISFFRQPLRIEKGTTTVSFVLENLDVMEFDEKPVKKDSGADDSALSKDADGQEIKASGDGSSPSGSAGSSGTSASSDTAAPAREPKEQSGSGGGFTWVYKDDVLAITLSGITTVDSGTDLIYILSQSYDYSDRELEGVSFLGYERLKKESAGQNAYGYDQWEIVEEIQFAMPRTGQSERFYLWVFSREGSASTYKSSLSLQL